MTAAVPAVAGTERRLAPVDGLRGIAILLVMQYHFWGISFGLFGRAETLAVDRWATNVFGLGWVGVDLFFVLSGFLITGILLDVKGRAGFFRSFYARRGLRIFPIYYVFLAFVMFVIPLIPAFDDGLAVVAQPARLREDQVWFWTYLLNVGTSLKAVDVHPPAVHLHFWSLAVEEQFYLLWPLVVLAFDRAKLTYVCIAMVVAAFVFRIALTEGFASSIFNSSAPTVLMPAKMDTLALGGLIAIAARGDGLAAIRRYAPWAMAGAAGIVAVLFIANDGLALYDTSAIRWGYSALALFFASALVAALGLRPGSLGYRGLTTPVLLTLGKYSYAMYVVHLLVSFELARQIAVNQWWRTAGESQIPFNILFSIVATGLTFGVAWLSWQLLEQPILAQKRRFAYGSHAAVSSPLAPGGVNVTPAPGTEP